MKIAYCTFLFNPAERPVFVRNHAAFSAVFPRPIDTLEVTFGRPPEVPGSIEFRGGPDNILWQKERIVNAWAERLPAEYDAVAWIDADLLGFPEDLDDRIEAALADTPVAQLFRTTTMMGESKVKHGLLSPVDEHRSPGGAWAARREVFPIYDGNIIGGGDSMTAQGWIGRFDHPYIRRRNTAWKRSYLRWAADAWRKVRGRIGHVPLDLFHLYHGDRSGRQYDTREGVLIRKGFDPATDIALDENGLWRWARGGAIRRHVEAYFPSRGDGPQTA